MITFRRSTFENGFWKRKPPTLKKTIFLPSKCNFKFQRQDLGQWFGSFFILPKLGHPSLIVQSRGIRKMSGNKNPARKKSWNTFCPKLHALKSCWLQQDLYISNKGHNLVHWFYYHWRGGFSDCKMKKKDNLWFRPRLTGWTRDGNLPACGFKYKYTQVSGKQEHPHVTERHSGPTWPFRSQSIQSIWMCFQTGSASEVYYDMEARWGMPGWLDKWPFQAVNLCYSHISF